MEDKNKGMTQSKLVSRLRKQIKDIQKNVTSGLDDRQMALLLFNEKMFAAMGLHQTIRNDESGSMIFYLHDETTLEDSKTIYKFSSGGLAWTMDGWNDGRPLWTSGLADNGDAILNQIFAYVVSADLIKTGLLKSENGASWINMNDGTFCFRAADEWIDIDTGQVDREYYPVLELVNKQLSIYGAIKSTRFPGVSASIGISDNGNSGAFTVTDNRNGYGDLFQCYRAVINASSGDEKGTVWTAPFLLNSEKTNRKGISIFPNEITMFSNSGEAVVDGFASRIATHGDAIEINQKVFKDGRLWFNWAGPPAGCYRTLTYCFGNNSEGGYGTVNCGELTAQGSITAQGGITAQGSVWTKDLVAEGGLIVGGVGYWENAGASFNKSVAIGAHWNGYALSVGGTAKAKLWEMESDPNAKENIRAQDNLNAIDKIKTLKFYSYDFKDSGVTNAISVQKFNNGPKAKSAEETISKTPIHVDLGIMSDEAPKEIQGADGKSIDLCSYISMTAKAVQELAAKVEEQARVIEQLKAELRK